MEEMSLAKAINDEDNEMPAVLLTTTPAEDNEMTGVLSTTIPAEELDEMIKVIKEDDKFVVTRSRQQLCVSLEIEAESMPRKKKVKDNMGLELPSLNLASQIPIDDHKNILREQVAKENADADDVQEDERASGVVYESKDHCIEELITSKIKEENEKSSEIGESPGAEATTNEAAIDQKSPRSNIQKKSKEFQQQLKEREENMKGYGVSGKMI
ncbi:hypothetical protein OIU84_024839 [Salix udensis]|uniref:Uncharacterized protein n=1 Tax=Salix udensis TaxID=889485 RepID=A0AAD6PBR9_9ROSI|nr:hypothetical protein OIU84_024839 [Salix udensis]